MSSHPCAERLLLPEALTGRLDPAQERRVMAHLESCPACQEAAADIEVALISLATLQAPLQAPLEAVDPDPVPIPLRMPDRAHRKHRLRTQLLAAAAAVVLLAGGAAAGHALLPARGSVDFGPSLALAPPAGSADQAARGTVAVAAQADSLAVKLEATSLPAAGWYECVWISAGQTRSAGSFRATNGVADVQLRVAQPQSGAAWDLQVIAHRGTTSEVVLEGSAGYPS